MPIDYTRILQGLSNDPNSEDPGLRLRTGVVTALNSTGTVDLTLGGGTVPAVPVLDGVVLAVGAVVQVLSARGTLLVIGGVSAGALSKASVYNANNPTFTSTTYTELSGANICSVAFLAPSSGAVKLIIEGWLGMSSTNLRCRALMTGQVRLGSTLNSGTIIDAAADSQAAVHDGEDNSGFTYKYAHVDYVVSGLTPGVYYNVTTMHRVNSSPVVTGGGAAHHRRIFVEPW